MPAILPQALLAHAAPAVAAAPVADPPAVDSGVLVPAATRRTGRAGFHPWLPGRRQQQAADDLAAQRREAREEVARLRALVRIQAEPADTLRQAQAQLRSLDSTAVQTRLQRASARIRQQSLGLQRRQLQVLAPTRGRVLRLDVHEAEAVMRGTPVAWFAPDAPLIVRAELDERLFTRVRVGMPAQVESESGSGRRFGARLTSIAPHVGPVRALPEVRTAASDDHVVECVFALDTGGLLIGQRVIVRVLGTP